LTVRGQQLVANFGKIDAAHRRFVAALSASRMRWPMIFY
jgi:hypothetical protein